MTDQNGTEIQTSVMEPARLLLVDDHEPNLLVLREVLRRDEVEFLCAQSGVEALELLLKCDVALAIIDVQMPEMDGLELAEVMRGVERAKHVPIIFVTAGSSEPACRFRGYEAGAVDFIYKPIEVEVLRQKVSVFLAMDRQRRELVRMLAECTEAKRLARESEARLQVLTSRLERMVEERTKALVQSQKRLRALTTELNLTEQRERKRIATELHDHLQQMLVIGKITIGQGKRAASSVPAYETILNKVDDILSNALTYSRTLVAELSPPVLRDHGLAASLKWLAEFMEKKHNHTVTVVVPDDQNNLEVSDDHVMLLFQCVRELLINSSKHAGTGRATVTMELQMDQLCLTVRDEGKGFDLVSAAAAEATPDGGISSKFGLFSIQERMHALGGSFTMDAAPGLGTTAILVVPLTKTRDDQTVTAADSSVISECLQTKKSAGKIRPGDCLSLRVLLVDDHAMVRQGLRSVLEAYADIEVTGEARDGVEAVKLVEELRPHAVVMDINMPKMNGIEATEAIKNHYPETVVIGLSVNADGENQDAMKRAGAVHLMTKEAAVEELHDAIVEAVTQNRSLASH
ncbi:MAG TPA: response regulator [Nitrospira sp.]|nr:response regulator [Nitrospira sp.]